jgi:hypothetical protein
MDQASLDENLRAFLAGRDEPCPGCGYNLRGLTSSACPECNQSLCLTVSLVEPRTGSLIAAIVALAVGAGAAGVWLFFLVCLSLYYGGAPPAWFAVVPGLTVVVEGSLLLLLARKAGRIWFRTISGPASRLVVGSCVALTSSCVLVYLLQFMRAF